MFPGLMDTDSIHDLSWPKIKDEIIEHYLKSTMLPHITQSNRVLEGILEKSQNCTRINHAEKRIIKADFQQVCEYMHKMIQCCQMRDYGWDC